MTSCEQDPDIFRWGLHHLLGDLSMKDYYGIDVQDGTNICDGGYMQENNSHMDHSSVENDEVIAHTLQEEYSNIANAESSRPQHENEEQMQTSVLAQDWFDPPMMNNSYSGNESSHNAGDNLHSSSWCPSPEEKVYDNEGEIPLELTDEFSSFDGEVGKRLNHVVPVPHVPKINGEIPTIDEATSDHQRLLDRLRVYDLVELKVQGDGNCQFRALSDQLYRTPEHHKFVRKQILNQLKSHPEMYEGYVPMAYSEYLNKISKNGEWGDHVTLQAAADTYGIKIFVLTSFKDTCYIEILPVFQKSKRVIFLSFWAEVHYNSIYPEGDFPEMETKKKKKWWHFGK